MRVFVFSEYSVMPNDNNDDAIRKVWTASYSYQKSQAVFHRESYQHPYADGSGCSSPYTGDFYYRAFNNLIQDATSKDEVLDILDDIQDLLLNGERFW